MALTSLQTTARRRIDQLARRPLVATAVVAFMVRAAVAVVSFVVNHGVLIPDERQYIDLAATVAAGRDPETWVAGYGDQLYRGTYAFLGPLARLQAVFGDSRLVGQLWAAMLGTAVAVLTTWFALQIVDRHRALVAGTIAALLPSQVLWSSVVLREAAVWLAMLGIACGLALALRRERRATLLAFVVMASGLIALGHLRQQAMLAAAWALAIAAVLLVRRIGVGLALGAVAIVVVAPLVMGYGAGGFDFAAQSVPSLGAVRTRLSFGAESAFTATTLAESMNTTTPSETDTRTPSETTSTTTPPAVVVDPFTGTSYAVDESGEASLRHIPRGFVGTMLRPWPLERTSGASALLARAENVVWYVLYALALFGLWRALRRPKARQLLLFPVLAGGGLLVASFLAEGNVGTAFRHRGQVLWVLAILVSVAVTELARRRAEPVPLRQEPVANSIGS